MQRFARPGHVRAHARGVVGRRDRRRRRSVHVQPDRARRGSAHCGGQRRRRVPDAPSTRRPAIAHASAARRRARARRAARRALGVGGDDLRTLRLRARLVLRGDQPRARVHVVRAAVRAARGRSASSSRTRRSSRFRRCTSVPACSGPACSRAADSGGSSGRSTTPRSGVTAPGRSAGSSTSVTGRSTAMPRTGTSRDGRRARPSRSCASSKHWPRRRPPNATSGPTCWRSTGRRRVNAYLLPPDHALFLLLATPRRLRYRMGDRLWVRLVDVGAALSGRKYSDDGAIVFDVRDEFCPWNEGRWKLEGGAADSHGGRRRHRTARAVARLGVSRRSVVCRTRACGPRRGVA